MNDETQIPGAGPTGTGQETNLGGTASEWSTVPPVQPPTPPAPPPAQSLEPLPPAPQPPPPPAPAPAAPQSAAGYQPVYGSQPQSPPAYASAPGGGYTPPSPQGPPPGNVGGPGPQYPPPPPPPSAGQGLSSNAAAAISYITFIPAVLFLVMEPYNRDRFVRFHSWQSIALSVVWIGIAILFSIVHYVGFHLVLWMFHSLIDLVLFVFWLIALIKASQGQWYKIPIVGDLAASFGGAQQ